MKNAATQILEQAGHKVTISDLYGQGFTPQAQKWDFVTTSGNHFNYMLEQKHAASLEMAFSPDIASEIQKVQAADIVLFVAPMWWMNVPAIMRGWFDRVLAMGFAWDSGKFYENGLLRGKQAMLALAAGHPAEYFQPGGAHRASAVQLLHPINYGTLGFCGFNVHEPYIAYNLLGTDQAAREQLLKDFTYRLQHLIDSPQWLIYYR